MAFWLSASAVVLLGMRAPLMGHLLSNETRDRRGELRRGCAHDGRGRIPERHQRRSFVPHVYELARTGDRDILRVRRMSISLRRLESPFTPGPSALDVGPIASARCPGSFGPGPSAVTPGRSASRLGPGAFGRGAGAARPGPTAARPGPSVLEGGPNAPQHVPRWYVPRMISFAPTDDQRLMVDSVASFAKTLRARLRETEKERAV